MRDGARFHDGKPITPEDVVFSLEAIKKASPRYAFYYKNVIKAEKIGDRQVKFEFDVKGNRELPMIVGELPVLPKHFWESTGANGEPRDLSKSTLEDTSGLGSLSHQARGCGSHDHLRACPGLVGQGFARVEGAMELR